MKAVVRFPHNVFERFSAAEENAKTVGWKGLDEFSSRENAPFYKPKIVKTHQSGRVRSGQVRFS